MYAVAFRIAKLSFIAFITTPVWGILGWLGMLPAAAIILWTPGGIILTTVYLLGAIIRRETDTDNLKFKTIVYLTLLVAGFLALYFFNSPTRQIFNVVLEYFGIIPFVPNG